MKRTTIFSLLIPMLVAACSGSDIPPTGVVETATGAGPYLIAVQSEQGTEYVMQAKSLEDNDLNIKDNSGEMPNTDYTWVFRNQLAIGMSYQQKDPGEGYAIEIADSLQPLQLVGRFLITDRYTTFGFLGDSFLTSVSGQTDGKRHDLSTFCFWDITPTGLKLNHRKTFATSDLAGDGEQLTFSSIVDNGDGTFMSALIKSGFNDNAALGNGSSIGKVTKADSCWVVMMDKDLNILHTYKDDRISYAAGQYRSQTLSSLLKADDGTIYVFSNGYEPTTTLPAGALRINRGEEQFDPNYYFNLEEACEGYKFRRVWHITENLFLLELYNTKKASSTGQASHFAIADMKAKKVQMVSGLPNKLNIVSGQNTGDIPLYHRGKIYLPITERNQHAALYLINIETGKAQKGITINGARQIRAVGYLTK